MIRSESGTMPPFDRLAHFRIDPVDEIAEPVADLPLPAG